jgi:aminobenzoyl-glutamate utilization protein B
MNVGVNYMREHMPSDARVHYALLDAGGIAPNVVQANAKVRYLIRARNLPELTRLIERVRKIADGAALMTETSVKAQVVSAVSNLLGNTPLEKAMHDNLLRLGPPPFDDADRDFAREIQTTLTDEDIESAFRRAGMPIKDVPLCDEIVPLDAKSAPMMGSTDVGDVSWVVPTVQARGATYAIGTPGHSWQLTAQGKTAAAHKGLVHVAKVMACTAVDVLQDECCWRAPRPIIRRAWDGRPMSARCRTNWSRRSRCPRRSGVRFIVRSGERGQTNFLGSLLNLERVFRPEYLLADHQRGCLAAAPEGPLRRRPISRVLLVAPTPANVS